MAQFNPALITTNLLEAAVVELCMRLQRAEQQFTPADGDRQPNKIQVSIDTDAKTVKISALLPIEFGFVSGGSIGVVGVEYLPGVIPDNGTTPGGGDGLSTYRLDFTEQSFSNGLLTVTHNLGGTPVAITITNGAGMVVMPDNIAIVSANAIAITLESFRPLVGTWSVAVGV